MDLRQIRYFLGLAQELHFWNASEKMHITQSSLSRHIQSMEEELGYTLFDRNQRRVSLTPAGRFLRDEWQRLIMEIENIHRHAGMISKGEAGEVRIGHIGSVAHSVLPDLLAHLSDRHPFLKIGLAELPAELIGQGLLDFRIDIGLRREAGGDARLEERLIGEEHFALAFSSRHPLVINLKSDSANAPQGRDGPDGLRPEKTAKEKLTPGRLSEATVDLGMLKDETFILPPLNNRTGYAQTLLNVFHSYGFEPKTRYESDFGAMILALVAKGLGISVMPESYARSGIQEVKFIRIPHRIGLYLVTRKGEKNQMVARVVEALTAGEICELAGIETN